MHKNISVVIPAYNEEDFLPTCLDSLVEQKTKYEFEVILVNNNSTDKTGKVAKSYKNKLDIEVIDELKKGRGTARRTGFAKAKGSIIFSTDADAVLPPNWIEDMMSFFTNPNIIAVTTPCKIVDLSPFQNIVFNFGQPLLMRIYRILFGHYWLSGFSFAIKRESYEKTKGFSQELNALEDIELGFEVKKIGKIIFASNLIVIFSSRRFNNGLINGLFQYISTFVKFFLFKNKSIELDDVRD